MGTQWPGMARQLMAIPAFNDSLKKSSAALESFGIDVYKMLNSDDPNQYKNNTLNCMLAITAIQVTKISFRLSRNSGHTPNTVSEIQKFLKISLRSH